MRPHLVREREVAGEALRTAPVGVDLARRTDIHNLVVGFYREVVFDELLEPIFGEVAEVDWATHIPKLIDYWCRVLLGEQGYRGALVAAHRHVHDLQSFELAYFDRWYELWVQSIDTSYAGPLAEQAKSHAARIGASLARQLLDATWVPPTGAPLHTDTERTIHDRLPLQPS